MNREQVEILLRALYESARGCDDRREQPDYSDIIKFIYDNLPPSFFMDLHTGEISNERVSETKWALDYVLSDFGADAY